MGDELLVCMLIRRTTWVISSALKCENSTRCSVWQLTQPPSARFCSGVPGTLMSNSPLESCAASFEALVTLLSCRSNWAGCPPTSTEVLGSSYPAARTLIAYLPGCSLSRGKVYWPWALLTTQVAMVEPAFFAPTITPSIGPSACEVTLPVRADEDEISAAITGPAKARPSNAAPTALHASIALLMANLPLPSNGLKPRFSRAFSRAAFSRIRPAAGCGNRWRGSLARAAFSAVRLAPACRGGRIDRQRNVVAEGGFQTLDGAGLIAAARAAADADG